MTKHSAMMIMMIIMMMMLILVFYKVETETGNAQMLIGCLMFLVQDAAALEEADLRQSDGYSEISARNSGNVFAAGRRRDEQTMMIKCCRLSILIFISLSFVSF